MQALQAKANQLRGDVLKIVTTSKSGHPGGALGMADLLTALYYKYLRHDPRNPQWDDRDRFVLSNGHTCPILYAILADQGYFDRDELWSFRKLGAMLQGHPSTAWKIPGVEACSGSLGNGLSVALGMAMGAKLAKRDSRIYCFVSDGELQEGQPWEAATAAAHHRVDNLCMMIDWNGCQIDGRVREIPSLWLECSRNRWPRLWSDHECLCLIPCRQRLRQANGHCRAYAVGQRGLLHGRRPQVAPRVLVERADGAGVCRSRTGQSVCIASLAAKMAVYHSRNSGLEVSKYFSRSVRRLLANEQRIRYRCGIDRNDITIGDLPTDDRAGKRILYEPFQRTG
jgi:transketolase N-terminal domain/subunit